MTGKRPDSLSGETEFDSFAEAPGHDEVMHPQVNIEKLTAALSELTSHQQLAFGAMCCERMIPGYDHFAQEAKWGDSTPLRKALDQAWKACSGGRQMEVELQELLRLCEQSTPDSADFASLYVSPAQNAALAACSLLDYLLGGELSDIAYVPQLATDSVDLIVQELAEMDTLDADRESKILGHALMQQELRRQERDLRDVAYLEGGDSTALEALRRRAQSESILLTTAP